MLLERGESRQKMYPGFEAGEDLEGQRKGQHWMGGC